MDRFQWGAMSGGASRCRNNGGDMGCQRFSPHHSYYLYFEGGWVTAIGGILATFQGLWNPRDFPERAERKWMIYSLEPPGGSMRT